MSARLSDRPLRNWVPFSTLLRQRKLADSGKGTNAADMCAALLRDAMSRVEVSSRNVIGACSDHATLPNNMRTLRNLASYDPPDTIALRRNIAGRLLAAGSYTI